MQEEKEQQESKEAFFETTDIHCASALLTVPMGYTLMYIDKHDPKNCVFVFALKNGIEETAKWYFLNRLDVRARAFADNLRSLKNQIYR